MNKYIKTTAVAVIMLAVSTIGFGIAFGYGSSGGSGGTIINGLFNGTAVLGTGAQAVVASTPTITTAPTTGKVLGVSTYNFNLDMRRGASNEDVRQLQIALTSDGSYSGPITGTFGQLTLNAVKAFQAKRGLPQTGFVGPMTRNALNSDTTSTTPSSNISAGDLIKVLLAAGVISPDKAALARTALGL